MADELFILGGNLGQYINERIQKKYGRHGAISAVRYNSQTGVVEGSTPHYCIAANEFLSLEGFVTASHADLERALKRDGLVLENKDIDSGLILRKPGMPNGDLSEDFLIQIRARNPKAKLPIVTPLSELELVSDENFPSKLTFNLKDSAQVHYSVTILHCRIFPFSTDMDKTFLPEDIDDDTGLPNKFTNNGTRTLYIYARPKGVSRLALSRSGNVFACEGDLNHSSKWGRIVIRKRN
jgi:hypothetical protein